MQTRFRYSSLRNGLVGYWRPSRGATGNTLLDSVRGNHGTLTNGPTWQASGSGLALSFDGTDDFVTVPNVLSQLGTRVSVSTWFLNRGNFTAYPLLFGGGNTSLNRDLALFLGGNASQVFVAIRNIAGNLISLSTTMQLNQWIHLVLTADGTTAQVFINGVFAGSATNVFGSSNMATEWRLGSFSTIGGAAFNGLQDSVSVHSAVLTPSEILTLYTAGRGALDQRVNVPVVRGFTSGGAYTLTADSGTFALSGQNATVTANRVLTADQASFTAAGQTANLLRSRLLTVDQATFTAIGQDAALKASRLLTADQATYTLSGQDVALVSGNTLTAENATFTLAGQTASFVLSRRITADQAAFALSGQDATLTYSSATSEVPYLEIDFVSGNRATGTLTTLAATGSISVIQATGTLVVSEAES